MKQLDITNFRFLKKFEQKFSKITISKLFRKLFRKKTKKVKTMDTSGLSKVMCGKIQKFTNVMKGKNMKFFEKIPPLILVPLQAGNIDTSIQIPKMRSLHIICCLMKKKM